jgi:hypothetical protein
MERGIEFYRTQPARQTHRAHIVCGLKMAQTLGGLRMAQVSQPRNMRGRKSHRPSASHALVAPVEHQSRLSDALVTL